MDNKISVIINTLNEEKNILKVIRSAKKIADEIVVVDMMSDDGTAKIAKKAGANVYMFERVGYVEPARNFAISKAKHGWILILDADERLPKNLVHTLKQIVSEGNADYCRVPRKNIIFGKWIEHTLWWPDYNIRFFKKGAVSWSEIIHSVPETRGKGLDIAAIESLAIVHYNYTSISSFVERMNRYTSFQAKNLLESGYTPDWKDMIGSFSREFLARYFRAQGYKDGVHGLALSIMQGFSEFLVYAKAWENRGFKELDLNLGEVVGEMKKTQRDSNYWQAFTLFREGGGILMRLRSKLKI